MTKGEEKHDGAQSIAQTLSCIMTFLQEEIPPGPKFIPLNWVINFQKALTSIFMLLLMTYYNNFSLGCWLYLSLHGTYGALWCLKELIFPDAKFRTKITFFSAVSALAIILLPYWVAGFLMVSGQANQNPSPERIALSVSLCILGSVLMMGADLHKHVQLQYKKGLISDGLFSNTRNPNYLGEMMIYGSFAILVDEAIPFYILAYVWTLLFSGNMFLKDQLSLKKKIGWSVYSQRSWMLIPKIGGSFFLSLIFYSLFGALSYSIYAEGSFEAVLLKCRPCLLDFVTNVSNLKNDL